MSTETDDSAENGARQQVERSYSIIIRAGVGAEALLETDGHPDVDESDTKARKRNFAQMLSEASPSNGEGKHDAFATSTTESSEDRREVLIGDTAIDFSDYRSEETFEELVRAAANYGGQHPLSFVDEEITETETEYDRSPGRIVRDLIRTFVTPQMPDEYDIGSDYPVFVRDGSKWRTGDEEQYVSLSYGAYGVIDERHYDSLNEDAPVAEVGVTVQADAEAAVDLLDAAMYDDFTDAVDETFGDVADITTGEKTTEVCKRTE